MTLSGYVKVYRKLINWGWYKDPVVKCVFFHFLFTASFRDMPWQDRVIQRGQLVTSYGRLAEDLGFTIQQVRTAIKKLKSTGEITSETTNKYTIITVVNWDNYQSTDTDTTFESTQCATNEQQSNNNQITINQQHRKNVKNVKEEKNICATRKLPDGFSDWESYWAHVAELKK